MKKYLFLLTSIVLLTSSSFAQTPLKLEIKHKLGASNFQMNQMVQNSLMQDFEVTNLRYYLSGFSIIHDGGQVTEVPDTLVFVDVSMDSLGYHLIELGDFFGSQIEGVSFYMGVDSARNHLDPSSYGPIHPLANKTPSMHWGWASGYFFLSFNGPCGQGLTEGFDLQCLGDDNYFETTVENPLITNYGDEILMSIQADYRGLLNDMDISQSISMHGPFLWARDALYNATQHVFNSTLTASYTAIDKEMDSGNFSISPNPLPMGQKLSIQPENELAKYSIFMIDLAGKEILRQDKLQGFAGLTIPTQQKGFYILTLIEENGMISTQKISVE